MSKIESIIIDYCKEEKPKYALLIDGKWGEGKTHFLKNSIATKINENSSVEYLFIYISLNGIEDTKSITDEIISKLLFPTESKTGKIVSSVLISSFEALKNKVGLSNNKLKLAEAIKLDNTILCFDDLERISSKLQIEDVLGYINTNFVEHNNINTIIVCDKSKIKESVDKEKSFDIIKEKVIGRTITFEYHIDDVIKLFKSEIIKNNEIFYIKHEQTFKDFFHKSKIKNLRTVFFIAYNFNKIIPCIDENFEDETIHNVINFILVASTEFKRGNTHTKEFYKTSKDDYRHLVLNNLLNKNPKSKYTITTEETKKDDFWEIYGKIDLECVNSIYDFIVNGFYNEININKDISILNSDILNKRDKPEYAVIKKIDNWRDCNEYEFNNLINEFKSNYENNIYSLYTIVNTLTYWYSFVDSSLIDCFGFRNFNQLDLYLSTIINNLSFKDEDSQTIHHLIHDDVRSKYSKLKLTENAITEKIIEFNKVAHSDKFNVDLENIKQDINLLSGIHEYDPFKYLLDNMTIEELSNLTIYFLQKDNEEFQRYQYKLRHTFSYSNAGEHNNEYKEKLDSLVLKLRGNIDSINDKIKKYHLCSFIELLIMKSKYLEDTK